MYEIRALVIFQKIPLRLCVMLMSHRTIATKLHAKGFDCTDEKKMYVLISFYADPQRSVFGLHMVYHIHHIHV